MIAVFPERYPDELLYSQLARYCVWSGNASYKAAAKDIFANKDVHMDPEFVARLTEETKRLLINENPYEEYLMETTMFKVYARFLKPGQRNMAMKEMIGGGRNLHRLLHIGQIYKEKDKYLKYCPFCVERDREKYGEAYWHRVHQIRNIKVCPEHGCLLKNGRVLLTGVGSPNLITVEQSVDDTTEEVSGTDLQIKAARYMQVFLEAPLDLNEELLVGPYIKSRLYGTRYASPRGGLIKAEILLSDMEVFYGNSVMSRQQLYDTLRGMRNHLDEICELGLFLQIVPEELIHPLIPEDVGPLAFDYKVRKMRLQNIPYRKIAEEMNASVNLVKPIGTGKYRSYSQAGHGTGKKQKRGYDYDAMDRKLFPNVRTTIDQLLDTDRASRRVCIGTVSRIMGIRPDALRRMKKSYQEVLKYQESYEQYWQRKILWSILKIEKDNKPICLTSIINMTGIKRDNALKTMLSIDDYRVKEIIGKYDYDKQIR